MRYIDINQPILRKENRQAGEMATMGKNTGESPGTQSVADYEYNTLMRLLGVSVSKHLLDEHYTLIWANDFYYQLIGWPKEEYVAKFRNRPDLYYADHPEEWNELVSTVTEALRTHQNGYNLVTRMPRKDGSHVWVNISNVFGEEYINGNPVSYTVITDVDDLVRMQKEQSITYDNLPGFVAKFQVNENGFRFLEGNERFRKFFGYKQNSTDYGLSNLDTEKNRQAYAQHFPLMRKGERVHFTLQAKDKTGGNVWLQLNADCIDRVNGNPVYLVIYIDITDITEQRELQKQLEERSEMLHNALQAAEQANKAKSDFLSQMSHDIRTPMNAIIGMTAIAGSHIEDKDRVRDCLQKITVSSKLLLGLINEVLDMSRIESGRISITEEEFSLSEVLQNIVTIIQPSIMAKRHAFDIQARELQHENVIGDPQHIQQVFLNVLSNAIKYTPDGGKILFSIREKPSQKAGYGCYEFVFRDNGYGMKSEFLKKIFKPFERAEDAAVRAVQGTGLGMAISKNIVQMMNGDIQVESTYGKGSTFTVTLSLKLQDEEKTAFRLPELSVLVVDDDRIACETTCERLKEIGLKGQWVLSGKEAIQKAVAAHEEKNDFSTIIIDLKMPDMDGIETTRRIREKIGPDIPIILISAYDWTEYETEARAAGVNGFIVKPMLKSSLVYAIKKYTLKEPVHSAFVEPARQRLSFPGKRVLLVEDNDLNREIAEEILGQTGASVETAVNGQEALEKFCTRPEFYYDLVFMDLQMPVMDGLEATRQIRNLSRKDAQTVPIVAMTANAFTEDVEATKAAGMNAHLAKPLDIGLLDQVMNRYLGEETLQIP